MEGFSYLKEVQRLFQWSFTPIAKTFKEVSGVYNKKVSSVCKENSRKLQESFNKFFAISLLHRSHRSWPSRGRVTILLEIDWLHLQYASPAPTCIVWHQTLIEALTSEVPLQSPVGGGQKSFQRSAIGWSTAGNDVLATIIIGRFSFFPPPIFPPSRPFLIEGVLGSKNLFSESCLECPKI